MDSQLLVDAVWFGTLLSVFVQAVKMLPKEWVTALFTTDKETYKMRMQMFVFAASVVYVSIQAFLQDMWSFEDMGGLIAMLGTVLTVSYGVYQTAIKRVTDRYTNVD